MPREEEFQTSVFIAITLSYLSCMLYDMSLGETLEFIGSLDLDEKTDGDLDDLCQTIMGAVMCGMDDIECVLDELGINDFRSSDDDEAEESSDSEWLP